jgi:hypothetical protein
LKEPKEALPQFDANPVDKIQDFYNEGEDYLLEAFDGKEKW